MQFLANYDEKKANHWRIREQKYFDRNEEVFVSAALRFDGGAGIVVG